ncbi:hypothetical protein RhiirA5_437232 [Rhizophagus irregularis]|uniref:Uncharacterized protein n=1 Tax=Rhizophagus irregularis TaxID=588596 RepID=A0A2N0NKT2_9GLOM|nr:hypothetical protein RhiirA5_437232 [Rhizophagus irregularis]
MEQTVSFQGKILFWSSSDNTNKLCYRYGKLSCAPNFCLLKQIRERTHTRDPVTKLKKHFNINQPRHSNSNANTHSRYQSRSKFRDRSASAFAARRDNNNPKNKNNNINSQTNSNSDTSLRAHHVTNSQSCLISNNILNLLRELQCEVAYFHKRISALELADQRMSRIESHLGLALIPTPNKPDIDLIQEDTPISHIPLNIQSSAKSSSSPPINILTASSFTPIFSMQKEINDLKNSRVVIESKLNQLTGHIKQFISFIGNAFLEQADSASSV